MKILVTTVRCTLQSIDFMIEPHKLLPTMIDISFLWPENLYNYMYFLIEKLFIRNKLSYLYSYQCKDENKKIVGKKSIKYRRMHKFNIIWSSREKPEGRNQYLRRYNSLVVRMKISISIYD